MDKYKNVTGTSAKGSRGLNIDDDSHIFIGKGNDDPYFCLEKVLSKLSNLRNNDNLIWTIEQMEMATRDALPLDHARVNSYINSDHAL